MKKTHGPRFVIRKSIVFGDWIVVEKTYLFNHKVHTFETGAAAIRFVQERLGVVY